MSSEEKLPTAVKSTAADRRQGQRFTTAMAIDIRFSTDGTPLDGSCLEISPNGMRVLTNMPLVEATYVLISFKQASNNTNCEGRVVWTRRSEDNTRFESGIDVQRWGGGIPGQDAVTSFKKIKPHNDRRKKSR